jgi:hypothetical protein
MASQPIDAPTPLYAILGTIPALPRPILRALATRIIERLDEIDGDPDLEDDDPDTGVEDGPEGFDPEEDMCLAGDDRIASGSCTGAMLLCEDTGPGDADDAEPDGFDIRADHTRSTRGRACFARRSRYTGRIERYDFRREPVTPTKRQLLRRKRGAPVRPRA